MSINCFSISPTSNEKVLLQKIEIQNLKKLKKIIEIQNFEKLKKKSKFKISKENHTYKIFGFRNFEILFFRDLVTMPNKNAFTIKIKIYDLIFHSNYNFIFRNENEF
jgi:hypothetical protein